jgi:hypothetical protein
MNKRIFEQTTVCVCGQQNFKKGKVKQKIICLHFRVQKIFHVVNFHDIPTRKKK